MIFGLFLDCFLIILALTFQLCLNADSEEWEVTEKNNADELPGEEYFYDREDYMDEGSDYDGYEEIEQLDELEDTNYDIYKEGYELENDI